MLSAKKVQRVKARGRYYDTGDGVPGLCLQVSASGAKSWLLRYEINGKKRWMGLGSSRVFTLREARERARLHRQKLADGIDPLKVRRDERAAAKRAAAKALTFREAAIQYHQLHEHEWRNRKHAAQFISTLETYAYPVLGDTNVADIDTPDVLRVIEPIWISKTETASRVRGRIESVLGWAGVRGYRTTKDNPARWRGHLEEALPKRSKVAKVEHHPALPYAELPAFMAALREREGVAAHALEFTILTTARTGETVGAHWSEIDFEDKKWTVPAGRMKGEREHKVPLSNHAIELLKSLYREGDANGFLFIGLRQDRPLSNMAMTAVIRRMNEDRSKQGLPRYVDPKQGNNDITTHGFRSSFRDWCAEQTNYPREVAEMALAHRVGDETERAYLRGDPLKKRRQLAEAWSRYCTSPVVEPKTSTVVAIQGAR